jgi:Leucine-rich repeat (LRR) protein
LERLQIRDTLVHNLDALKQSKHIKYLDLRGSQVTSIEPLRGLDSLEILLVNPQSIQDIHLLPDKVKVSHTPILDES